MLPFTIEMNGAMQSWYARNMATPGLPVNSQDGASNLQRNRGSYNKNGSYHTVSSLPVANPYSTISSKTNQLQNKGVGKTYFNPYINNGPANKNRQQCVVTAPTKIVNCDRDQVPMSQLTTSFESNTHGSHFSQENRCRQHISNRVALGGPSGIGGGIAPFNTNRSVVDSSSSSTNFSQMHGLSERNSFPSSVSQETAPDSRFRVRSLLAQEQTQSQSSHSSFQRSNDLAPMNSQDKYQTSRYSNPFLSHDTSKSGIPQFQAEKHYYSQSTSTGTGSRSLSKSQGQQSYQNHEDHIHSLIDNHVRDVLDQRLAPKFKELNDHQLSFYRRMSDADEKHIEYMEEVGRKHDACMKQINELDKRSIKIEHQFVHVTKTIAKCTTEMEKQADEFHAKGLYVESLYSKVTDMLKSIELSTVNLKEIAANSIVSIKQTHESVMESTIPFIKQKAAEIITSFVSGLGFNRIDGAATSPAGIAKIEELNLLAFSKEHTSALNDLRTGSSKESTELNREAANAKSISSSSLANKNLKSKQDVPLSNVLKPLTFTKVNSDSCDHLRTSKVRKLVQDTTNRAAAKGKLKKYGKAFQETSSPKTQTYQHSRNTTPQPSKLVSPMASMDSKPFKFYTPLPSLVTVCRSRSCETPSRNKAATEVEAILPLVKNRSPSRKRNIPDKSTMNKRSRTRYGRVRTRIEDEEAEYSFLSN